MPKEIGSQWVQRFFCYRANASIKKSLKSPLIYVFNWHFT